MLQFDYTTHRWPKLGLVQAIALAAGLLAVAGPVWAAETVLYQSNGLTAPQQQGFLQYFSDDFQNYTAVTPAGTTLDTSSGNAIRAGYSSHSPVTPGPLVNAAFPTLDRSAGFDVQMDLRLIAQVNDGTNGPDRAGLSVIVLGSDARGVELGFRGNQIFAQNDGSGGTTLFTQGESTVYDTTAGVTRYDLSLAGNNYTLSANGLPLLTGPVRDYSASPNPPFPAANPYTLSSFLFLGDDTTSARASSELSRLSIVPEPGSVLTALAGGLLLLLKRRHRRGEAC